MWLDRRVSGFAAVVATVALAAVVPQRRAAAGPPEGDVRNGLSSVAFRRNPLTTSRESLAILSASPLASQTLAIDKITLALHHPRARAVMTEMVRCALGPGTTLQYTDPADGKPYKWTGELGLCQGGDPAAGDWSTAPPTPLCQELVSACLAARVNALAKSIPISVRGEPEGLFPLNATVRAAARYREAIPGSDPAVGVLIDSFLRLDCPDQTDCGWKGAFVGRCEGGSPVRLAVADPQLCQMPVRACTGIHGCVGAEAAWSESFERPAYAAVIAEKESACASAPLEFACPSEEHYSVMVRKLVPVPGSTTMRPPEITDLAGGGYPATEAQVFAFREGAFFGNLFDPSGLTRDCSMAATTAGLQCLSLDGQPVPPCTDANPENCGIDENTLPYRRLYACFSAEQAGGANDSVSAAYFNDRICSEPDAEHPCFAQPPRRCATQCQWDAARGVYRDCTVTEGANQGQTTYRPITTYLELPCDLLGDPALCETVRASVGGGGGIGGGVPPVTPGPHGCGCATGGSTTGALASLGLGALVAARLRRRRGAAR
jgi:MYXO-CTERM domain-containing protein